MTVFSPAPDAAAMAAAVRQIAFLSHRALSTPEVDPCEVEALASRVAQLRREARGRSHASIASWLSRLESRLDEICTGTAC